MYTLLFLCYRLQQDPPAGVSAAPTENNIMIWNAVIFGYVLALVHSTGDLAFQMDSSSSLIRFSETFAVALDIWRNFDSLAQIFAL